MKLVGIYFFLLYHRWCLMHRQARKLRVTVIPKCVQIMNVLFHCRRQHYTIKGNFRVHFTNKVVHVSHCFIRKGSSLSLCFAPSFVGRRARSLFSVLAACERWVCTRGLDAVLTIKLVFRAYKTATNCCVACAVHEQLPFLFPPALIGAVRHGFVHHNWNLCLCGGT